MEKERKIEFAILGLIIGLAFGYIFGSENLLRRKKRSEQSGSVAGTGSEEPLMEEDSCDESCF